MHISTDMRSIMIVTGQPSMEDIASIEIVITEATESENTTEIAMTLMGNSILVSLTLKMQIRIGEVLKKATIRSLKYLKADQDLTMALTTQEMTSTAMLRGTQLAKLK